jgi:hypothetical protein
VPIPAVAGTGRLRQLSESKLPGPDGAGPVSQAGLVAGRRGSSSGSLADNRQYPLHVLLQRRGAPAARLRRRTASIAASAASI